MASRSRPPRPRPPPSAWAIPLVAKAIAPGLLHKSDVGGVVLGLESPAAVAGAVATLRERMHAIGTPLEASSCSARSRGGIEALVGVTTDATFGPLLVCGLGGVLVELVRDVAFRLPPVSDVDAPRCSSQLRAGPLLDGYRGTPPGDREALVDARHARLGAGRDRPRAPRARSQPGQGPRAGRTA